MEHDKGLKLEKVNIFNCYKICSFSGKSLKSLQVSEIFNPQCAMAMEIVNNISTARANKSY